VTHDSAGHLDVALLTDLLRLDDSEFYLCGPSAFMKSLYGGLTALGVPKERVRYESFGPATVLGGEVERDGRTPAGPPAREPIQVCFAASGVELEWSADKGTLLELAEAAGLDPAHSCRSGICGTCATRIRCGGVDYLEEPSAPHAEDEVLICCSVPRPSAAEASCGEECGVVLEL
jgi:ferredoxin